MMYNEQSLQAVSIYHGARTMTRLSSHLLECRYVGRVRHFTSETDSHLMQWFYKYFFPDNATEETLRDPLMSPLMAESLADLPPALIVPAEVDVLRDEGIAYATRLAKESDSWTQLWLAKRVPHPFPHQTEATELAVEFRRLAIQRLGEAFTGTLPPKEQSLSNVV